VKHRDHTVQRNGRYNGIRLKLLMVQTRCLYSNFKLIFPACKLWESFPLGQYRPITEYHNLALYCV